MPRLWALACGAVLLACSSNSGNVDAGPDGGPACSGGAVSCGTSCVDPASFASDPRNCGACNHDCRGTTCAGGLCQSILLASGQAPWAMAVDTTNVYWSGVMKCAVGGCNQTPTRISGTTGGVGGLAIDATSVYWTDGGTSGTVYKCALAGCATPTQLATAQPLPLGIAVDATSVYWTNLTGGTVMKCAVGGCAGTPTQLASSNAPRVIAVDSMNVYWGDTMASSIYKCPLDGCGSTTPATIIAGWRVVNLAEDSTGVYYSDPQAGIVNRTSLDGHTTVSLGSGQNLPRAIALDDTYAYWVNEGGTVMKCAKAGCGTPTMLASDQSGPHSIAVDATSVYWGNTAQGTVMRVSK